MNHKYLYFFLFLRQPGHYSHVVLIAETVSERVAKALECSLEAVSDCLLPGLLYTKGLGLHSHTKKKKKNLNCIFLDVTGVRKILLTYVILT